MTPTEFQTLDASNLSIATGGKTASPGGGTPPHKDFADKYVDNLKQDGQDWWNREKATATDLKAHKWGSAAKNFGGVLLDEVGTVGDAIAPVKALF
ncbi:MAG TPA: hypothetical protein VHW23_03820 [Kofleriaceae bacterium]|jgi:hypothetical protein|nr:hypothetical protein [Kofleriaceae bacterium]